MSLDQEQLKVWQQSGHVTVNGFFSESDIAAALSDLDKWAGEFLSQLRPEQENWFLESRVDSRRVLRKLDHPVYHRPLFRTLASSRPLVSIVEQLIGPGLRVWFSQVFLKPADGGGPKPVHQDNFYFGPSDPNGVVTAWLALDDATEENGCLFFADGSHRDGVHPHFAPESEPFNLQIPAEIVARYEMTAAPVSRGGVSFHHGTTLHQSGPNRSSRPRPAVAIHYVNGRTTFENPALDYDESLVVTIADDE